MGLLPARWMKRIMDPRTRVRSAWVLLWISILGWPLTALTIARHEPQVVLGLSWFAIAMTAWDIVNTTDIREKQEEG